MMMSIKRIMDTIDNVGWCGTEKMREAEEEFAAALVEAGRLR